MFRTTFQKLRYLSLKRKIAVGYVVLLSFYVLTGRDQLDSSKPIVFCAFQGIGVVGGTANEEQYFEQFTPNEGSAYPAFAIYKDKLYYWDRSDNSLLILQRGMIKRRLSPAKKLVKDTYISSIQLTRGGFFLNAYLFANGEWTKAHVLKLDAQNGFVSLVPNAKEVKSSPNSLAYALLRSDGNIEIRNQGQHKVVPLAGHTHSWDCDAYNDRIYLVDYPRPNDISRIDSDGTRRTWSS